MPTSLEEARNLLVRRWGEMGGYWGINRTMAEIHALLFVTHEPLCTDDIMERLQISRGNASMNLRGLVDWGLIQRVHKLGDRKEYFQADADVWRMFETIMRERRRREVEPIITTLDRCLETVSESDPRTNGSPDAVREFRNRVKSLRDFLATLGMLFELLMEAGGNGLDGLTNLMRSQMGAAVADEPEPAPRKRASEGRATRR